MKKQYQYSLLEGDDEIRLLRLRHGRFEDDIRIDLFITKLSPSTLPIPKYEALSYTWGSQVHLKTIFVGVEDATLHVTRNLAEALLYLRDENRDRVLWIDAICICQKNLQERAHQVANMADIYSNAARVVIWLGPEAENSTLALENLEYLGSAIDIDRDPADLFTIRARDKSKDHLVDELPYDVIQRKGILYLLQRPWFQRLWVQQEVYHGNDKTIMVCGTAELRWQTFRKAIYLLSQNFVIGPDTPPEDDSLITDIMYLAGLGKDAPLDLLPVLHRSQHTFCADPRDRIFAVQSMISNGRAKQWKLKPDYTKSVRQVYRDAAVHFIENSASLSGLLYCGSRNRNDVIESPSWVPDWAIRAPHAFQTPGCVCNHSIDAEVDFPDSGCLRTKALHVDVVETMSPFKIAMIPTRESGRELIRDIKSKFPADHPMDPYIGGGHMLEAYCVCLVGGYFQEFFRGSWSPWASLKDGMDILSRILLSPANNDHYTDEVNYVLDNGVHFFDQMRMACHNRALMKSKQGLIGLCPIGTRPGDSIRIFHTVCRPVILRPNSAGRHQVIGACGWVSGLMNCEAFLGPLPSGYKMVYGHQMGHVFKYIDEETHSRVRDPRLEKFWDNKKKVYRLDEMRAAITSRANMQEVELV